MNILTMLPLLEGWRLFRVKGSRAVKAGETTEIFESEDEERLWLLGAYVHTNVEDSGIIADIYISGGQNVRYEIIPKSLYDSGFIEPNDIAPYVGTYDTSGSVFVAIFNPREPVPIYGKMVIKLVGGSSDSTIDYDAKVIDVVDPESFYKSIKEVIGIKEIEKPMSKPSVPILPPYQEMEYSGFIP